jgi:hypothetical protein
MDNDGRRVRPPVWFHPILAFRVLVSVTER